MRRSQACQLPRFVTRDQIQSNFSYITAWDGGKGMFLRLLLVFYTVAMVCLPCGGCGGRVSGGRRLSAVGVSILGESIEHAHIGNLRRVGTGLASPL